jgi:hypothetical protein
MELRALRKVRAGEKRGDLGAWGEVSSMGRRVPEDDEPVVCVLMLRDFVMPDSWSVRATAPWERTRRAVMPRLESRKT